MSNKVRMKLVLLLIILKEAGPTAAHPCSCLSPCSPSWICTSWGCFCMNRGLTSVPQDLPTYIIRLFLHKNAITTLSQSDFSRYRSLTSLDLRDNQISMIHNNTFQDLSSLTRLYLYGNHLTILTAGTFVGLGNLQTLWLHNNQLTSLRADILVGLGNLTELWLHNNQLTSLPADIFEGVGNLERLRLDSNNIHSIEAGTFNDTTQLRTLELQYNNISTITTHTLGNLLQLETLEISHNNISTFPAEALLNLNISVLSELGLDYNQLETLPLMAYDILASISDVNIDNNPWQCDCRMAPFKQRMNGSYPFENQIRCDGPANLIGQNLRDVNPEDLICEETTPVYSTSSTKHIADSTLSFSPVSSSSPFHLSAKPTSKAPTFPPTQSNTPTADSKPHLPTVSTDPPFAFQSTMTSAESNTGPAAGGIFLSVPLVASLGVILGLFVICTIALAVGCMYIVYKRRQRDPTLQQGFSNTNPTGTSSGHDQIGLNALETNINEEINSQSATPYPHREDSQHIYNLPTDDDPDTAEYNTIAEVN